MPISLEGRGLAAVIAGSLALGACSFTGGVGGVVVARPECAPAAAPAPIADAEVRLECAGASPRVARSDASGRFFIQLEESLADACTVQARKSGYRAERRTLGEICADGWRGLDECGAASFYAELSPEAAAPGRASTSATTEAGSGAPSSTPSAPPAGGAP